MSSGRKPTPTFLKLVKGTAREGRLPISEPKPRGHLHEPPPGLSARELELWTWYITNAPPGLLTNLDRETLRFWVGYCEAYYIAAEDVAKRGHYLKPKRRKVKGRWRNPRPSDVTINPSVWLMKNAALGAKQYLTELGFSPAARTRIDLALSQPLTPNGTREANQQALEFDL